MKDNAVRKWSCSKLGGASQTGAAGGGAKPEPTPRQVLLCNQEDWKGAVYYELLPPDGKLNANPCRRWSEPANKGKRPR